MNDPRGRRPLRTTLAGWLRALFRRNPPVPDPEQTANADRQGAGAVEPGQGTIRAETSAGGRSGPPEHWLALAGSKGPPQHWLDLIRARLGGDLSRVRWMRGRALPPSPGVKDAAPRAAQFPPAKEAQPAPTFREPDVEFSEGGKKDKPFPPETGPVSQADVEIRPAPSAERHPLAAMRMYPARAEPPPLPAAQPRPAPLAQDQPLAENKSRRAGAPQPDLQARPRPISLTDGRTPQQSEAPRPPALPPAPAQVSDRPISAQSPIPPAPTSAREVKDTPVQAMPKATPREPGTPQDEAWPAWQGPTFAVPVVGPEPSAAPQKRSGLEPTPPTRPNWPQPPVEMRPQNPAQPGASGAWPVRGEPGQAVHRAERDLPASPAPAERWPALEPAADDDLAGDDWENYQRDWQRLERLRREQQGQLWSEWPF